jgi:hypothetical protein
MITTIRLFILVTIGYFIIRLVSQGGASEYDREYSCFYGNDMSEVYPIMAKSQMEAEDKLSRQVPDQNYESFCRLKKEVR